MVLLTLLCMGIIFLNYFAISVTIVLNCNLPAPFRQGHSLRPILNALKATGIIKEHKEDCEKRN